MGVKLVIKSLRKMDYLAELKVTDTVTVTQYGVTSFFFRNPAIKVLTLVIFNINTSFSCTFTKNNQVIIHYYMKTINLSNMLHNPHIVCSTSGILFAFEEPLRHSSMMASRIVKCFGTLNVHQRTYPLLIQFVNVYIPYKEY